MSDTNDQIRAILKRELMNPWLLLAVAISFVIGFTIGRLSA